MTKADKQPYLGNLLVPFRTTERDSPVQEYSNVIVPVDNLDYATRDYRTAVRNIPGSGAQLNWFSEIVPSGFVEVFDFINILVDPGSIANTFQFFIRLEGITGTTLDMMFSQVDVAVGNEINVLGLNGDTTPRFFYPRSLVLPAGSSLFIRSNLVVPIGPGATVCFLSYRKPGYPAKNSVQDVTDTLMP